MRTSDVRTESGIQLEKLVLAKGGTREDMVLVLDEAPDFLDDTAERLIERATLVRGDRNCFRLTDDDLVIPMPALKHPALPQIQKDWDYVDRIECDDSPEEAFQLHLSTVLKNTEPRIDGPTYERRILTLRKAGRFPGLQHRQWLVKNQDNAEAIPDPKARAALKALLWKVHIVCPGLVVVGRDGRRYVPCAGSDGGRWYDVWNDLDSGFNDFGRIAVSSPDALVGAGK